MTVEIPIYPVYAVLIGIFMTFCGSYFVWMDNNPEDPTEEFVAWMLLIAWVVSVGALWKIAL